MTDIINRQKQKRLESMLATGVVMVHLDPRRDGVVVPEHLASDPSLRLNLAYGFNLPRFDVSPNGVFAVLSFGGCNFGCTLPWESIFAMTSPGDPEGTVWLESAPSEVYMSPPSVARLRVVED